MFLGVVAGLLACDAETGTDGAVDTDGSSGAGDSSGAGETAVTTTGAATSAASTSATSAPVTTAATSSPEPSTTSGSDESSGSSGSAAEGCTPDALELIDLLNAYRAENGLGSIPASSSLCRVGDLHVQDLVAEAPHTVANCNLHSWSDAGPWSGCCYTPDHAAAQCMWDKPRELTDYPGNGYENAAGGGSSLGPAEALDLWKGSSGHNAVMLNEGTWANLTWNAVGVGIADGYAVLWFGEEPDPAP